MAVYQGARQRATLPLGLDGLTGRRPRADASPGSREDLGERRATGTKARAGVSRRAARAVRADRRPSSVGLALASIVIVFAAAFLSLSQSVRVAATSYDIVRLGSEHERLQAISQDLRSDVDRLRSEHAIRKQALDAGLGQLGAPIIIPAR